MTLSDFIGKGAVFNDEPIIILYVGVEDGYVMFGFKNNKKLIFVNSKEVKVNIQYLNRPALHGITSFIGRTTISAIWKDDDGSIIKQNKTKIMDASLSDVTIKNPIN